MPEHTTYYLNDFQGNVIFEETEDSSSAYYFMDTQLWGMEQNKQLFQIIRDYQGSVRAVVQNGKILNAYTYRLYGGDARTFESTPCTLRYLARPLDKDVGLYFSRTDGTMRKSVVSMARIRRQGSFRLMFMLEETVSTI